MTIRYIEMTVRYKPLDLRISCCYNEDTEQPITAVGKNTPNRVGAEHIQGG